MRCTTNILLVVVMINCVLGENQCKDMLQGYLTGQLASALGSLQVEGLRKEMKLQNENTEATCLKEISKLKAQFSYETQGYAAGEFYEHTGGSADTLCLPWDPECGKYDDAKNAHRGYLYGSEYHFSDSPDAVLRSVHDHDVPCSVCKISDKTTTLMIPGRKTCHTGWDKGYSGCLVSAYHVQKGHSGYKCLDELPDMLHGGHANRDGMAFSIQWRPNVDP